MIKHFIGGIKKSFFYLLFIGVLLLSCKKKYRLSDKDLNVFPYSGNESLVFLSSFGKSEMIKLSGYERTLIKVNNHKNEQYFSERYILKFNSLASGMKSDLAPFNYFAFLTSDIKGKFLTIITMWHSSLVYSVFNIDTLFSSKTVLTDFEMRNKKLNDVLVLDNKKSDEGAHHFSNASNFSKIYWSKSKGLVGYVMDSGEFWRLVEIKTVK